MISKKISLETNRLKLRLPLVSDLKTVFEASKTKGFNDGMVWSPTETIDELLPNHYRSIDDWEKGISYTFSIDNKESSEFVGRISIRLKNNVWDIGFMTFPQHQGNGYITEATKTIIDFGFDTLKAKRIEIGHAIWNDASKKIIQKCGFTYLRNNPKGFQKNEEWVEEVVYYIEKQ